MKGVLFVCVLNVWPGAWLIASTGWSECPNWWIGKRVSKENPLPSVGALHTMQTGGMQVCPEEQLPEIWRMELPPAAGRARE